MSTKDTDLPGIPIDCPDDLDAILGPSKLWETFRKTHPPIAKDITIEGHAQPCECSICQDTIRTLLSAFD